MGCAVAVSRRFVTGVATQQTAFVAFIDRTDHLSTLSSFLDAPSHSFAVECVPFRRLEVFASAQCHLSIGRLIRRCAREVWTRRARMSTGEIRDRGLK